VPSISYDETLRTPYAQHYNLTLQRDVREIAPLIGGYVGSKGTKLTRMRDINRPFTYRDRYAGRPFSTPDPANILSRRSEPAPHSDCIPVHRRTVETAASSTYHALQAYIHQAHGARPFDSEHLYVVKVDDDASDPMGLRVTRDFRKQQ